MRNLSSFEGPSRHVSESERVREVAPSLREGRGANCRNNPTARNEIRSGPRGPLRSLLTRVALYFASLSFFFRFSSSVAVSPLAEAVVLLLSDWSPVVALVLLVSDWSPVVVVVLLLSDWSPVDVVLSMVRLERPRRSTVGETVEEEPVTDESTLEVEPVMAESLLAVEPVIEELELAPAAVVELSVPVLLPAAMPAAEPLALPACESGMQSW